MTDTEVLKAGSNNVDIINTPAVQAQIEQVSETASQERKGLFEKIKDRIFGEEELDPEVETFAAKAEKNGLLADVRDRIAVAWFPQFNALGDNYQFIKIFAKSGFSLSKTRAYFKEEGEWLDKVSSLIRTPLGLIPGAGAITAMVDTFRKRNNNKDIVAHRSIFSGLMDKIFKK